MKFLTGFNEHGAPKKGEKKGRKEERRKEIREKEENLHTSVKSLPHKFKFLTVSNESALPFVNTMFSVSCTILLFCFLFYFPLFFLLQMRVRE